MKNTREVLLAIDASADCPREVRSILEDTYPGAELQEASFEDLTRGVSGGVALAVVYGGKRERVNTLAEAQPNLPVHHLRDESTLHVHRKLTLQEEALSHQVVKERNWQRGDRKLRALMGEIKTSMHAREEEMDLEGIRALAETLEQRVFGQKPVEKTDAVKAGGVVQRTESGVYLAYMGASLKDLEGGGVFQLAQDYDTTLIGREQLGFRLHRGWSGVRVMTGPEGFLNIHMGMIHQGRFFPVSTFYCPQRGEDRFSDPIGAHSFVYGSETVSTQEASMAERLLLPVKRDISKEGFPPLPSRAY
jgi:hypothetical protein